MDNQLNFIKLNMKNKAILCMVFALFAVAFAVSMISAFVTIDKVEISNQEVYPSSQDAALGVSETVPVEVWFTADETATDVKVKVSLEKGGFRDDIEESTSRFNIIAGKSYKKTFTLKLPSSADVDDLDSDNGLDFISEELDLNVKFTAEDQDSVDESFPITLQRELYSLNVLSIDIPQVVTAGSSVAVDVVVENNGNDQLENVYVRASIPELGVQSRIYVGDIDPLDESNYPADWDDDRNLNRDDTVLRRIYLTLPRNTLPGAYNLDVEAYNVDTSVIAHGKAVVSEVDTQILASTNTKTVAPGQETTYSLVLVNPGNSIAVYSITPQAVEGLTITVDNSIVTVPASGSATVNIVVKATKDVSEGTHLVTVNVVNSETSELVKQATFTLNVEKAAGTTTIGGTGTNATFILTVVLVIIFVVLLIILIVLLTRRSEEPEEFGETSYY